MSTTRLFIHIVHISEKKDFYMFYDLNQDDRIYLQFMIWMAMTTFPFNLDFRHERNTVVSIILYRDNNNVL
jgi:hypothetical protein